MANKDLDLEKLNRTMNSLVKAFEKMGPTIAKATDALLKAVKLMEEENQRKYKDAFYNPDIITQEYLETLRKVFDVEQIYDVQTNADIIKFTSFKDGITTIEKVFRAERGMEKIIDITETYTRY